MDVMTTVTRSEGTVLGMYCAPIACCPRSGDATEEATKRRTTRLFEKNERGRKEFFNSLGGVMTFLLNGDGDATGILL
jgi:hypothetical protein